MAKKPDLSREESDKILGRIAAGESVYVVAREYDRYASNLYSLLRRRYSHDFPAKGSYWQPKIRLPKEDTVLAYIAGLVDGEGSVMRRKDGLWTVKIGMTDEPVIRWLSDITNTSVFVSERQPPRKYCYTWSIGRRHDVLIFLRAIEPYMRVKRATAQQAIQELTERVEQGRLQNRES